MACLHALHAALSPAFTLPPGPVQLPVPPQHYFSPVAGGNSARQAQSPKFPTVGKPESPEEFIRPKDLREPVQKPRRVVCGHLTLHIIYH